MNIWVITTSYPRHPEESVNAGVLARDLSRTFVDLGHAVHVITPAKPGGITFDHDIGGHEIPFWRPSMTLSDLRASSPVDAFRVSSLMARAWRSLRVLAATDRPDAMVALWAIPSGIFARWVHRDIGAPYVTWMLGSDVWRTPQLPFGTRLLRRVMKDAAANYADGIALAQRATQLGGTPVSFVPSVRRLPLPTEPLPSHTDFVYVGRFHPNKGPDVLLDAFELVLRIRPARLHMFGSGPLDRELRDRARAIALPGCVEIAGPIGALKLSRRLITTKALVIPSRIESIPLVLGDAAQVGTPVIATQVGDMGRIAHHIPGSVTVPPNDPSALARAMLTLMEQGTDSSQEARHAVKLFDPDAAALEFLRVLEMAT